MTYSPPPGWYRDPEASSRLRWWSGEAWTERTVDADQTRAVTRYRRARPLAWLGGIVLLVALIGAVVAYVGPEYRGLGSQTLFPFHSPGVWRVQFRPGLHALYVHATDSETSLASQNVYVRSKDQQLLRISASHGSYAYSAGGKSITFHSVATFDIPRQGIYVVEVTKPGFDITVGFPVGTSVGSALPWIWLALAGVTMSAVGFLARGRFRRLDLGDPRQLGYR
jgi:hypothetical protein